MTVSHWYGLAADGLDQKDSLLRLFLPVYRIGDGLGLGHCYQLLIS
jgi:hypothetical protein